ncbi:Tic22 family protein [Planktothrix pseudagardhii]|uniref:Protein TIC 22-like, chloroplastic n=1 Tax=Planktothrix pseudagardhii TaxID=132604 RepID=A0A9W4CUT3_9CYAN|nr:Tic22 family protein [Planktothrix pseudagardhii]CAD5975985.1 Protein TIC 22-like, chloroplastic [Planktothrix pseudagardhii]
MRSIVRLGAVLGIVGSTFLLSPDPTLRWFASLPMGTQPAYALPENQILEKLRSIPVFTITDTQGAPLVATVPQADNKKASVAGVFISRNDAVAFVDNLKTRNPQLASTVQVTTVSLGEVYRMSQQAQGNQDDIQFAYVPVQKQVDLAKSVLQENGQSVNEFNGVPLFIAKGGPDQGYLTIQNGNEQVIPIFFNKEDLQNMLTQFKTQQPDLISSIKIDVVNLEGLLDALKRDNDQFLNRIVLIPPRETLEYLKQNQPQSQPRR